MFKDLPEGQTHSFSECCKECEEWEPYDKRLSRTSCKHCPCHQRVWEERAVETVERITIDYANLSGRESANRVEFRKRVETHLLSFLTIERKQFQEDMQTAINLAYLKGQTDEKEKVLEKVEEMVEKYWQFSDEQQPLSSWHEKQSLIAKLQSMK